VGLVDGGHRLGQEPLKGEGVILARFLELELGCLSSGHHVTRQAIQPGPQSSPMLAGPLGQAGEEDVPVAGLPRDLTDVA
jgi:hypothetical protein